MHSIIDQRWLLYHGYCHHAQTSAQKERFWKDFFHKVWHINLDTCIEVTHQLYISNSYYYTTGSG
jgi:hypothetical protein